MLALHAWGKPDPRAFGWYEAPPEESIVAAERLLTMLGALTAEVSGQITPLGQRLMSLPVHPRLARLLMDAAEHGLLREGATIAALLSEKDLARGMEPSGGGFEPGQAKVQGDSDLTLRMHMLDDAERHRFAAHLRDRGIDPVAARQVAKTRDELLRVAAPSAIQYALARSSPSPYERGSARGGRRSCGCASFRWTPPSP